MGKLVKFAPTKKSILRQAQREIQRMYQMSYGGQVPIPRIESRELFELGWIDEVEWLDWPTYCRRVLNRIFEDS
jgi:hypothetical protein